MAHEEKRFQLRPVDDEGPAAEEHVLRLERGEERVPTLLPANRPRRPPPAPPEPSHRLALPDKDTGEKRTHQPSVESILTPAGSEVDGMEHAWGDGAIRRHPIPWGWFGLIGLAVLAAVVWGLATMREGEEQIREIRNETVDHLIQEEAKDREAEEMINRIETSIRSLFAAGDPAVMSRWVRHPDRVLPLMERHYAGGPPDHGRVERIASIQPITLDRRADFWTARVILAGGGKQDLLIELPAEGPALVDWETMVCYQPLPWDEFARGRPSGRSLDFRVYVEPDLLHSHEFANSSQWSCYRLTARAGEETLFGYARVGSPEEQELKGMIEGNGGHTISLILRLLVPEGLTSPRGVVIEKILSRHWVYIDPPETDTP